MDKKDFYYELPEHLIAQQPAAERSGSRLMRLDRKTGQMQHRMFKEIVSLLRPGDCLVVNDSRVIPARLIGKTAAGSDIELLLHERVGEKRWTALVKPGRRAREGAELTFGDGLLTGRVEEILTEEEGLRVISFEHEGEFEAILMDVGEMPLPHYIHERGDESRYQTVYAKHDGSVAAPTAGLHFTEEIMQEIERAGIRIARVTLHVGIGTFRPVKEDDITKHHMHSEYCRVEPEVAELINETKRNGGRVIAIGTTSCRTLESRVDDNGQIVPGAGKTDIFIYPGYKFRAIDGLLTNFHLPESTLIMLVSAFCTREFTLAAYEEAVRQEYRFFSYGDAMLLM